MNAYNDSDIILYDVNDIRCMFGIGKIKAYKLMASHGFPSITINNKKLVQKDKRAAWLNPKAAKQSLSDIG